MHNPSGVTITCSQKPIVSNSTASMAKGESVARAEATFLWKVIVYLGIHSPNSLILQQKQLVCKRNFCLILIQLYKILQKCYPQGGFFLHGKRGELRENLIQHQNAVL
jgi:hypothetical protein